MNPAQKYALDVEATRRRYRYHDAVNETSWLPKCFLPVAEFNASELVTQRAAERAEDCINKAMKETK